MATLRLIQTTMAMLSPATRRRMSWTVLLSVVAAGLEAASVAIIFPFLAVAVSPDIVQTDPLIGPLKDLTGIASVRSFQLFLGVAALILVIASNVLGVVAKWVQMRFTADARTEISARLFDSIVRRDYSAFLNDSSARISNVVLVQSTGVGEYIIDSTVTLIRAGVTAAAILGLLLVTRPLATLGILAFFAGSYGLMYTINRRGLLKHGKGRVDSEQVRQLTVKETIAGIKEVKVYGTESVSSYEYARSTSRTMHHEGMVQILGAVPFHVMQLVAFGGLMAVFLFLLTGDSSLTAVIPVMGFFAFAGYRLLSPLQDGFNSISKLTASDPLVKSLEPYQQPFPVVQPPVASPSRFDLQMKIEIQDLHFRYPLANQSVLHGIDVTIHKGQTVAFVGSSGAGKTTLVDLIIGLLQPTRGAIEVDEKSIHGSLGPAWRASIGYVPQDVVLQDASLAQNVAFGLADDLIEEERVLAALRMAHLDQVVKALPDGIWSAIGDRGVRLSGGQRQRIGIARALYRNPDVIIFDEATSNLDAMSEQAITQAINELSGMKTIIVIAHRLTTVRDADCIYVMERGHVVSQGRYEELMESDPHFRALALADEESSVPTATPPP